MKSKYLKLALLSAVICFTQINTVKAQDPIAPCGTDENNEKMMLQNPELRQAYIDYVNALSLATKQSENRSTTLYTIPVVFHIIHINGTENVSDASVYSLMTRLNTDFRMLNTDYSSNPPYFQSIGGDALIQFQLAKLDPNGNCTNGIERIYSHKTLNAGERSKLNQWPREKYFNVWVINTLEVDPGTVGLVLAYATFPSSVNTFGFPSDGVIMRSDQVNGTSRTLTHEVGHWLGLEHTWGNTQVATVCGDDGVSDTPPNKGHFSTCPAYDFFCDNTALTSTYAFSSVTTTSGTTDPTATPYVVDSTMTFSSFTSTGVSANSSSANNFNYSDWDTGAANGETVYASLTGAINMGKYYQFTVTPDPNVAMSLTSMTFDFQRDSTGIRTYAVRSSVGGYATNLAASISPSNPNLSVQTGNVFFSNFDTTVSMTGSRITLSGTGFTGTSSPITFRIYGFNAEDTIGGFGIDNVVLTGTFGDAENVTNYMDYSSCTYMFTAGQIARMRASAESPIAQRSNLSLPSNLLATGTDGGTYPPCTPTTDFYADDNMICPGANIVFTPNILNLSQGATATYLWTFAGGTPATSTSASPTVVYNTAGGFDVTLQVTSSGGGGSTTVTKNSFIYVTDNFSQVPATYAEGFENPTTFYSLWQVKDLDVNMRTWWINNTAAYTGSRSIVMNGYYSYRDDVDQLISPSYNLSFMSSVVLSFRCAAATTATTAVDIQDKLIVYSSNDCGATWLPRTPTFIGTGTGNGNLINNSYHPEEYVPANASEWAYHTISVPTMYATANTRFKFEYTSGDESNSIYIDDINITGVLSVDESAIDAANVSIFPNPTNNSSTVSYHLNKKGDVRIELVDVLGKRMMQVNNSNQAEGDYSIQISKSELNLTGGIYFVKFTIDNTSITKKLIISE